MKRPLVAIAAALIVGIAAAEIYDSCKILISIILTALFVIYILRYRIRPYLSLCVLLALIFLFGGMEYLYVYRSNDSRFEGFYGKDVTIKGIVSSEPDIRDYKITYLIKTQQVSSLESTKNIKGKVILTTLKNSETGIYGYGSRIELKGRLNKPVGQRNPGGFNYRSYLAQSGISATIFSSSGDIVLYEGRDSNPAFELGMRIRNEIINTNNKLLPQNQAGLLNGMLIGYRGGLSDKVEQDFSNAGLTHIMAASGMNVAFIVFPLAFILKKLRFREKTANPLIICVLILFLFVTGFSPSITRAVIMAIVLLVAQMIRREADVYTSLAFAALILLVINPMTLFDIGFQLSFAATLSIVLFYKRINFALNSKGIPGLISSLLSVTLAAQAGTVPITAYYFNNISLISLFSNILVVPLVEAVTILGFIMIFLGQISMFAAQIIGYINNALLSFILLVTEISTKIPFSVIKVITPPVVLLLAYYTALGLCSNKDIFSKLKIHRAVYYISAFILIAYTALNIIPPRNLEVVFIDVGQGDSILVKTPEGRNILLDGGGSSNKTGNYNVGESVVIPFLLDYGIWKLDAVIASHGHDDHIQGLKPVLDKYDVGKLILHEGHDESLNEIRKIADYKGIPTEYCKTGDNLQIDEKTCIKVLYPKKDRMVSNSTLNNSSLVLKLIYKNVSVLFTGDIETEVEDMLYSDKADLNADVLKVAHHGSITSSSADFIATVAPKAAVISVGHNNFGHPSDIVIDRLSTCGVKLFRTDTNGAVIMKTDGKIIKFETMVD